MTQCGLTQHIKKHENPFSCDNCPKKFSDKWQLNKHVRSHQVLQELFEATQRPTEKKVYKQVLNKVNNQDFSDMGEKE